MPSNCGRIFDTKTLRFCVLVGSLSSDAHFSKKYKENSLNLL